MNCLADASCLRCSRRVSLPAFTGGFALLCYPYLFNLASESRIYSESGLPKLKCMCRDAAAPGTGGWTEQKSVLRALLAAGMLLCQTGGKDVGKELNKY